jgi:hypothetical protein
MDAIFKLVSIWNDHSMTNSAFSDTLGFITELLPQVRAVGGEFLIGSSMPHGLSHQAVDSSRFVCDCSCFSVEPLHVIIICITNDAACCDLLQDHTLPKSLYMMKQVLDVAPASKYEWHSCLLGCTGWPPTPQSEWKAHRQDCCKKCGGASFDVVLGKEVPVRVSAGQGWRRMQCSCGMF